MEKEIKGFEGYTVDTERVLQIDKNTNEVIAEFASASEVQRQFGYSQSHISKCCNNKPNYNTAYGYKWQYAS